jgi:hypothetical protein
MFVSQVTNVSQTIRNQRQHQGRKRKSQGGKRKVLSGDQGVYCGKPQEQMYFLFHAFKTFAPASKGNYENGMRHRLEIELKLLEYEFVRN